MSDRLIEEARRAALKAYAPYSRFSVGCAIESVDGEIATGSNMENACYRLGVCAEIAALTAAKQAFGLERIARLAVAGGHVGDAGELAGDMNVKPCGGCRQAILEAAHVSGRDLEVISANGSGTRVETQPISELLPAGFGPANLEDAG
ncbi:MAG: cytidine deaminase [Sphingosinicella sp.]